MWGDSSDDEDKVNETDDNNESVITKTNRNYLSEQNYRQTSKNEWTKHHSISWTVYIFSWDSNIS